MREVWPPIEAFSKSSIPELLAQERTSAAFVESVAQERTSAAFIESVRSRSRSWQRPRHKARLSSSVALVTSRTGVRSADGVAGHVPQAVEKPLVSVFKETGWSNASSSTTAHCLSVNDPLVILRDINSWVDTLCLSSWAIQPHKSQVHSNPCITASLLDTSYWMRRGRYQLKKVNF